MIFPVDAKISNPPFYGGFLQFMKRINLTKILLYAYYETLHELLVENTQRIEKAIDRSLAEQIEFLNPPDFDDEKFDAYREAAEAFLAERIEMYNPIGIQYTFDRPASALARRLELQLNWFDSTEEFDALKEAAEQLAEFDMSDDKLKQLAEKLIGRAGAFPDKSIITTYEDRPALQKLPDYTLAKAIEQTLRA